MGEIKTFTLYFTEVRLEEDARRGALLRKIGEKTKQARGKMETNGKCMGIRREQLKLNAKICT